jgi:hypothetical protein
MLGNCIGKGAFGSVWRGLHDTGTTVAVKQINLSDIPSAELDNIMVRACVCVCVKRKQQKKALRAIDVVVPFACYAPDDKWILSDFALSHGCVWPMPNWQPT